MRLSLLRDTHYSDARPGPVARQAGLPPASASGPLFVIGAMLYLRATRATDWIGRWAFGGFVGLLALAYFSGPFSAPPPSAGAVAIVNNVGCWLLIAWAAWVDRHREQRS